MSKAADSELVTV